MNVLLNSMNASTIGVILDAGLGNQLFMIFALVSYCMDYGFNYIIYSKKEKRSYWNTILDGFSQHMTTEDPNVNKVTYNDPHFHHTPIPKFDTDTNLKGYFQSHKYFDHNIHNIIKYMKLRPKLDTIYQQNKDILFKEIKSILPKELDSRKKIEIFSATSIDSKFYAIFVVDSKSRFIRKNADDLMELCEKLATFLDHNFKKKELLIKSPLCSKAKEYLKQNGWSVRVDFM